MKVKICGITTEEEAVWLNDAGVDYAGFVLFYEKSRRNLSLEKAKSIMEVLDASIIPVAVTVKPTRRQIQEIEAAGFGIIQIHGEIPEKELRDIRIPVWKALHVNELDCVQKYEAEDNVTGYVFDAQTPGSGKTFDWSVLKSLPETKKEVLLAGGLNPDNIAEAIRVMGDSITGVDTSSGVECESGMGKDKRKIERFVNAVK